MRLLIFISCLLLCSAPAWAGVDGADYDNMPLGPYTGTATVTPPGAAAVEVVPDSPSFGGASNLGNGSGQMLRIDTENHPGPVTVSFTFYCDVIPENLCRVKYDYAAAAWDMSSGFAVYVDNPEHDNPDDNWEPVIGFPPTIVGPGDNKENAGDCDGSTHTIDFVVQPGTILHLDNMETECLENIVPNTERSWSTIKAMFR